MLQQRSNDRFIRNVSNKSDKIKIEQIQQELINHGIASKKGHNIFLSCNKLLDAPQVSKNYQIIYKDNNPDILYIQLGNTIYSTIMDNNNNLQEYYMRVPIIGFSVNDIGNIKIELSYNFRLYIHYLSTDNKTYFQLNIQETDIDILWITDTLFIIYSDNNIYIYQIIIYNDSSTSLIIHNGTDFQLNSNNKQIKKIIKLSTTSIGILYNNEFKLFKIKYNSNNNNIQTIRKIYNTSLLNYEEEYYHITQYNTNNQDKYILLFSTDYVYKLNIAINKLTRIDYKDPNMQVSNIINIKVYNKYIIIGYKPCIKFYNLELYLLKEQTVDNVIITFDIIDNKIMIILSDDEILKLYDIYDTNIKSTNKNTITSSERNNSLR